MKKSILFLFFIFFLTACETGTRYDTNETHKKTLEEIKSGLVERNIEKDIENLLTEDEVENRDDFDKDVDYITVTEPLQREEYTHFTNALDVKKIRQGQHNGYVRLVLDIYNENSVAKHVGSYSAKYNRDRDEIFVILSGYSDFSASLPSFSVNSPIEQIYFENNQHNGQYKFHIKLRGSAEVKVSDLPNPARLIFDIKPI